MKDIHIYVEGPSDKDGMKELLKDIISDASRKGHNINFYPLNGKKNLLTQGPIKAINILKNKPGSYVFLIPDLYPENIVFTHRTFNELKDELLKRFSDQLRTKSCDERLMKRFFVHCFKYDFEALVLASENALLERLGERKFVENWTKPVENQDHGLPPKRIIERLFKDSGKRYKDTIDAPWILGRSRYHEIIERCPQNFKPFMDDLLNILELN